MSTIAMSSLKKVLSISVLTLGATLSIGCAAQDPVPTPDEHKGHHPAASAEAPQATADVSAGSGMMADMDKHMKAMQDMREKMAKATTPKERQELMAEHKKLMHDGMAMMKKMDGEKLGKEGSEKGGMGMMGDKGGMQCKMKERQQMMEKRMEMMQSMMEMMMDNMSSETDK